MSLTTVNEGARHRYGQLNRLLYMTDGLHIPKMYDGDSLVNWGIVAPTTKITVAATSTGANTLDLCEALWTPASLLISDCETSLTKPATLSNMVVGVSDSRKVGSYSSLVLLGYEQEPLDANTISCLHFNDIDGSTTITESAAGGLVWTCGATAEIDTAQFVFGVSSLYCDGTAATSRITTSGAALSSTQKTMEMRVRFAATPNTTIPLMTLDSPTNPATFGFDVNPTTGAWRAGDIYAGIYTITCTYAVTTGVWYHLRWSRDATYDYFYINGVLQGSKIIGRSCAATDGKLQIGGTDGTGGLGTNCLEGWIDEVRVDSVGRNSGGAFVVPTQEYSSLATPSNDPTGLTGTVAYKAFSAADYSGYYGVKFWAKSVKTIQAGDVSLKLCTDSAGAEAAESIPLPYLPAETWAQVTYKFVDPAALSAIKSIGVSINRDAGQNGLYFDDIKAIRCNITLETDPAFITQGASSMKFEIPGNVPSDTLLAYRDFTAADLSSDTVILLSARCSKDFGYQQFQYLLDNTAACASPLESLYLTDNMEKDVMHSMTLTLANPAACTAIISNGLKLKNRNIAPCTLWLDNIQRANGVGGNLTGRYFAWCSFYSEKYDRESDLSPISGVVDVQGQGISLTAIPVSTDPQVSARRIYRSAAGGTVPYLEATISDNTTTILTLNKSDAAILAANRHPSLEGGSGKFAPPPAASYLVQYKNRFLLAGSQPYSRGTVTATSASATFTFTTAQLDTSFIGRTLQIIGDTSSYIIESVNVVAGTCVARPIDDLIAGTYRGTTGAGKPYTITDESANTVYPSYIDDMDVARPHGFPIEYAQDIIEGAAGDKITGLGLVGDAVLVTKNFSTHLLEGNYPPYTNTRISSVVGCVSHDTLAQDEKGNAMWLAGAQGVAYSDGFNVTIISSKIQDVFTGGHELGLNVNLYDKAHAIYDVSTKLYYLFCASKTSSINDVCIVCDTTTPDPTKWDWYYFDNVEASASALVYDAYGIGSIYITDYDGFQYKLNDGWYDGISSGTLSGTATSATASILYDTGAVFYTTGSGLRNIPLLVYKISTGETWVYKITANGAGSITIDGVFTEIPNTADYKYYVGAYEVNWKSKKLELMRPTDKKLLLDGVVNNYTPTSSQPVKIQVLKNLAAAALASQIRDLSEGEEQVLLIRERVSQAQWSISGFVHGQNVQIVSLGLRLKAHGVR